MTTIYVPNGTISVPSDAVDRLEEWAHWSSPIGSGGRCASAEGRYDAVYPDENRGKNRTIFNINAVLAVERIVNTRLPKLYSEIVRRHFVWRDDPRMVARKLGINRYHYGGELKRSILMVKNNLTTM